MDDDAQDMRRTPRTAIAVRIAILRLLPRGGAVLLIGAAVLTAVLGVLPVAFVVATSVLLGRVPAAVGAGVPSEQWDALVTAFTLAALVFVAQQVLAPAASTLGRHLARRIDRQVYGELMNASLRSPGVELLEDQAALDDLRVAGLKLEFGVHTPGQACAGQIALLARYTQLAGFVVVTALAFSPLAALPLVVAVMLLRHAGRGGLAKYAEWRTRLARAERRGAYLRRLAAEPHAGREIRVFGLTGWLRDVYRTVYLMWLHELWRARRRTLLNSYAGFAAAALVVGAVVLGALGAVGADSLGLAAFVLAVQAVVGALRSSASVPEADMPTAVGMSAYDSVRRFTARVTASPPAASPPVAVPPPVSEIRFDGVGFRYPGQDHAVLDGFDLTIPAGRCTAVVGLNGAGKTTLVKLLARLYEPASGAIRLDGVDVRDYPVQAWRARIAVIFQDFLRYEASAADNIGFGAVEHLDDREGIRAAAASVGVAEALDRLPDGFDTPLARHVTGGAELSGGQWQRVALARALFAVRHGASLVVLDEPTASLDVRTEAEFFERFAGLTRDATTLLISHRFSTVRHADHIVVLEDGRVLESGTHDELLARRGRYAELFRLQAEQLTGEVAVR